MEDGWTCPFMRVCVCVCVTSARFVLSGCVVMPLLVSEVHVMNREGCARTAHARDVPKPYLHLGLLSHILDSHTRYIGVSGFLRCYQDAYKSGGLSRFYRGLMPYMARMAPASAIQFTVFDGLKNYFEGV